jgi:hypothetical protein
LFNVLKGEMTLVSAAMQALVFVLFLFEESSPCPPRQLTGRRHFAIAALCGSRTHGTLNQTRLQVVSSQSFNRTRLADFLSQTVLS